MVAMIIIISDNVLSELRHLKMFTFDLAARADAPGRRGIEQTRVPGPIANYGRPTKVKATHRRRSNTHRPLGP